LHDQRISGGYRRSSRGPSAKPTAIGIMMPARAIEAAVDALRAERDAKAN
jgi:hypothetical protein